MAAVFAANGSYTSPTTFVHGIRVALLVAAVVVSAAAIPALLGPSKSTALASLVQAGPLLSRQQEEATVAR